MLAVGPGRCCLPPPLLALGALVPQVQGGLRRSLCEGLEACAAADINGIKGHRSVGGFRASMYNALPISSVEVLVEVMKEFERTHG